MYIGWPGQDKIGEIYTGVGICAGRIFQMPPGVMREEYNKRWKLLLSY